LRMRLRKSPIESDTIMIYALLRSYQLALTTPGSSPLRAILRKQIRQIPNLR
jgi:hypothetical protein